MPTPATIARLLSNKRYGAKLLGVSPSTLLAYWPLAETTGAVAADASGNSRTGAYTSVDLGQSGMGDGGTAPYFDGTSDYVNVYTASLASAFLSASGSLTAWVQNNALWSSTTARYVVKLGVNSSTNLIYIRKGTSANTLACGYIAGSVSSLISVTAPHLDIAWTHVAITWDKAADQVKFYVDGLLVGTATGLGVWAGALAATHCCIGALSTTPTNVWDGGIAHVAFSNVALSASDVARLAVR